MVFLLLLTTQTVFTRADDKPASPLSQAHAHNDYLHDRPLYDALDHGFNSVEADVFLVGDKLLVGHTLGETTPDRTLAALYLDPLRQRVRSGGGQVQPGGGPFRLFIDIKSSAEPTYAALTTLLASYSDMLSQVQDDKFQTCAINVVISGNRPQATMAAEKKRFAGIDGRLSDLNSDVASHLIPVISDNWKSHFQWRGAGEIPAEEKQKLRQWVRQAHADGRQIRFWGTPDTPPMWRVLQDSGVDMINTDDLPGLEKFLRDNRSNH
ncbi:putative secreted protein [Blastopirellula marina DSM 3645]|uniref:Altered inheritance of mitochondria protein 6 n=1 Tax=Blastopirellula marina DSM 3645 TaxID=314230 RepID=A3ZUF0_9BACT|nr:putative secreted protein [Blastopirellula marina DSM 3645]